MAITYRKPLRCLELQRWYTAIDDCSGQHHANRSDEPTHGHPQAPRPCGGCSVYVEETQDGIVLRTVEPAMVRRRSAALYDGKDAGTVAEFVDEHHQRQE